MINKIVLFSLIFIAALYIFYEKNEKFIDSFECVSPTGKHKIKFEGNFNSNYSYAFNYPEVYMSLYENNNEIFRKEVFTHTVYNEWNSFDEYFSRKEWINDNFFKLSLEMNDNDSDENVLLIYNDSSKKIKCLEIRIVDFYFLFNLESKSMLEVKCRNTFFTDYLACEGEFDDGKEIKETSENIQQLSDDNIRNYYSKYIVYNFHVKDNSVNIFVEILDSKNKNLKFSKRRHLSHSVKTSP